MRPHSASLLAVAAALLGVATGIVGCKQQPQATSPSAQPASPSGDAPAAARKLKIGLSTQDAENQYWIELADEFKKAAGEKGVEVVFAAKYDPAAQARIVEDFIQQGVNAIVVSPVDPVAMQPVFDEARRKGILVVNNHFPTDPEFHDIFIDTGPYESGWIAGSWAAKYINEKLGGKAEVAVLTLPENKTLTTRVQGITDAVKQKAPGARIVAEQRAHSQEQAVKTTENILTAHPNVKVLLGWSDFVMLGAVAAIEGLGKNPADYVIVGIDATPDAVSAMMKSKMKASVDNPPRPFARLAFTVAYDMLTDPDSSWHFVKHAITKLRAVDETNLQEFVTRYGLQK